MAINPAKFIREVRREAGKINWPSRRETWVSTAIVIALAAISGVFFWIIDGLIRLVISVLLGV